MNQSNLLKRLALVFLAALAFYAFAYAGIEHRRTRNGPWRIVFTNLAGSPALLISQPKLALTNVWMVFPGESIPSPAGSLPPFDPSRPREGPFDVAYGKCLFMDTTFLPGTIVFELFGHEIQLLPRVLTIDKTERAWRADETISITRTNFFPSNPH